MTQTRTAAFIPIVAPVWVLFFVAARMLPLVPEAMPAIGAINGGIGVCLAILFFVNLRNLAMKNNKVHQKISAAVIPSAIVLISWVSTMELIGMSGLGGEDRVETVVEQSSGKTVYVYEAGGIPDGFISARVAMKYRYLPFEKTVATLDAPFQRAEQESGVVVLLFGRAGAVRVDMDSGLVE